MKQPKLYVLFICAAITVLVACSKSGTNGSVTVSVESLAGTYSLKALVWNYAGVSFNIYDSLDACDKDNLVELKTDKTVNFIDAGIVCDPAADDSGTWDLVGDSLIFSGSSDFDNAKIQSFDGTTLVLTGVPSGEVGVVATTTLQKQ